jgi:hypothetical protein
MDSFSVGGANNNNSGNNGNSFFSHIFSTNDESKAEFLNVFQYSLFAIIPVLLLNKFILYFIPDLDIDKSSLEILAEILLQIFFMFSGILLIHRFITFFPTYSGFKYDHFSFTNIIIAFFVLIFSIQTKLGLKVNTLYLRAYSSFFGEPHELPKHKLKPIQHHFQNDHSTQINTNTNTNTNTNNNNNNNNFYDSNPAPANSFISFTSF